MFSANPRAAFILALVSILCPISGSTEVRAEGLLDGPPSHRRSTSECPLPTGIDDLLATASVAMQQAKYLEAIKVLQPVEALACDPRVSLLLAAASEGSGDAGGAESVLRQAHQHWPQNNSVATSLAREYLSTGQPAKAGQALDHFHPTPDTSSRELEMAVVVLLANHELVPAREAATLAYKTDPSLNTLLLLANALQLEGRYKDVLALLKDKRASYDRSAAFLVTIAESEFDEKIFDAALADLTRAVSIDPALYQAHYLRGNALRWRDRRVSRSN